MRTITAAQAAVRATGSQADHVRVSVKDGGGTWRDLTSYPGFNAVAGVSVKNDVGSPHMTADVELTRESFKLSLSPYMTGSALNHGFDPVAAAVPLLAVGREFKVEVAITAMDHAPVSGDWMEIFTGRIDNLDPSAGDKVRFGGRDKAGRIADQQIKQERVYGYAVDGGLAVSLRPWEPGMVVAVGEYMLPASTGPSDSGYNKFLKCSTAGTAGNTEPTWTTGATQVDGTARWDYVGAPSSSGRPVEQVMQNLLDDNKAAGDATVTLYVPSSPSWAIKEYLQSREKNLSAVRALAQQIGWDVRMKWRSGTSAFELTLFEPERTKSTVDATFEPADYLEPTKLETALDAIRNSWQLVYSDASDTWPDGSPKRKTVTTSDSASIAKYGELWAEIAEPSGGNIDSATEANKMIAAALSDCAEPTADFQVPLAQGFPWVELGDRYTFNPDLRRFDVAQTFAVVGWTLHYENGRLGTELSLRGKPSLSAWTWVAVSTVMPFFQAETQQPPPFAHWAGRRTAEAGRSKVPGGVSIQLSEQLDQRQGDAEYEVHVSMASGFTLAADTLRGVIKDKFATIDGLKPGVTYYGKTVPRRRQRGKVARGQPGAQWSFVAGRVGAGLMDRLAVTGGPPNADFEDNYDTSETPAYPPEHWSLEAGTWGATGDVWRGLDSEQGTILALRQTATQGVVVSPWFRIAQSEDIAQTLAMIVTPSGTLSAGRGLQMQIGFSTDPAGTNSVGDVDVLCPYNFTTAGTWALFTAHVVPPAGAAYARVRFNKESASSAYGWSVASVHLSPSRRLTQPAWTAVTFENSWSNLGSGWQQAAYFEDMQGVVHMRGLVANASDPGFSSNIFTFPTALRPGKNSNHAVVANNKFARLEIDSSGQVRVVAADDASWWSFVSLDGITFDTR